MKKRNWLKTTIAMITLVATVLETGFTSVSTLAAEITTEDGIVVNNDAVEEADLDADSTDDLQIEITSDNGSDDETVNEADSEDADYEEEETFEEAEELKNGTLDVTDSGIWGSGYDEISIYVDTEDLGYKRSFRLEFTGPDSASYNPIVNEDLYKTNDGRYDFENLEGGDFTVRATSSDDVILSYTYNEDGYPTIVVKNTPVEKVLRKETVNNIDGDSYAALTGEGYDSVKIDFATDELSDKASYKLVVDTEADATVDGRSVKDDITGLDKNAGSVTIEDLDEREFTAYVVSEDTEAQIASVVSIKSTEDGEAVFTVDPVYTKRAYEFEDSKVKVTAVLEKADAIPDDAFFCVTPLTEEEAQRYLEALNASLEEGRPEVTADDILLYDIAFYTDETKSEEIEPEEGSVTVSIEFKKNQISEELGIENDEDVQVTHFEEAGNTIDPVTVDVDASAEEGTVEFSVESFSIYGIWAQQGVAEAQPGKAVTYSDVLGSAVNFGFVANEMRLAGHLESNFAVGTMHGSGQIQSCKNEGGGAGRVYIGAYDDTTKTFLMDKNGNSGVLKIFTTEDVLNKMDPAMKNRSGVEIDVHSMSESAIKSMVSTMITGVQTNSGSLMSEPNCYQYASLKNTNGEVDLTSRPGGTYYISFDTSDGATGNKFPVSGYTFRINGDQNLVFNIPDTSVEFGQYHLYVDGKQYTPQGNSDEEILFEKIIFNCPNATSAKTSSAVTGTFILPKADFTNESVAAGFLVANNIKSIGGQEWHCISKTIDKVEDDEAKLELEITKLLKDKAGNVVDDGLWPEEGFKFKIEKYVCNDPLDANDSNVERDKRFIPDFEREYVTIKKDTPGHKASFGTISFKGSDLFNNDTRAKWSGSYSNTKFRCFMYKITEVPGNASGIKYQTKPMYLKVFVNSQKVTVDNYTKYYVWFETKTNDNVQYYSCWPGLPEFVNTYEPAEIPVTLLGEKWVNGSTSQVPNDKFEFSLYKYTGSWTNFGTKLQSKKNVGANITFDPIKLKYDDGDDTRNGKSKFYFLIKETGCESPYDPDTSEYIAQVTLTKNANGGLNEPAVAYYKFDAGKASVGSIAPNVRFKINGDDRFAFDNKYDADGEAVIYGYKKLTGRDIQPTDVFTFSLSSTDDTQTNANQVKDFSATEVTSTGFEFAFDKLTYGLADRDKTYHYVVKEERCNAEHVTLDSREYTVTIGVKDKGTGKLEVTQDKGKKESPLQFENTYSADGNVFFKAHKIYETNSALSQNKWFSFKLEGGKVNGATIIPQEKKVQGEGTVKFDTISFADLNAVGDYEYTIREVIPTGAQYLKKADGTEDKTKKILEGIIYDARVYNILVAVSDNGSGTLQKAVYAAYDVKPQKTAQYKIDPGQEGEAVNPGFTNDYRVDQVERPVGGKKILYGNDKLESGMFTFTLAANNQAAKDAVADQTIIMPETSVMNGVPVGTVQPNEFLFGNIVFKAAGEYEFMIAEEKPAQTGNMVYSNDQFLVTFKVTDNGNGGLEVARTIKKVGSTAPFDDVEFINTSYNPGEIPLFAHKDLSGRKLVAGAFEFRLKQGDEVLQTVSNKANGEVDFEPLKFEYTDLNGAASKTFTYVIEEVIPEGYVSEDGGLTYTHKDAKRAYDGSKLGYTYDGHKETVNVTVTANSDGSLTVKADNAVAAENSIDKTAKNVVFENEYKAEGQVDLGGNKKVTGEDGFTDDMNNKFYAELYEDGVATAIDRQPITKSSTFWGGKGGEFNFDTIYYTQAEFENTSETTVQKHYIVKESQTDTMEGITNSTEVYEVTVTLTDNGDGTITAAKDKKPEEICFINTSDNFTNFLARKYVNGEVCADRQFTFELYGKDTAGTYTDLIDSKHNEDGGWVTFKSLNYTMADVERSPIEYQIREKITDKKGYTLDDTVFGAKAFISVNDAKELVVTPKYYKYVKNEETGAVVETEIPAAEVVFNNTYSPEGPVEIKVTKTLIGRDITEKNKFTFTLSDEKGNFVGNTSVISGEAGKPVVASFPVINYDQSDLDDAELTHLVAANTYKKYYTVVEDIPDGAIPQQDGTYKFGPYTYSGDVYIVEVTLVDDGEGFIDAKPTAIYKKGQVRENKTFWQKLKDNIIEFVTGETVDKAEFFNYYEADGYIDIVAGKTLIGMDLEEGKYSFELSGKDEDGNKFTQTKTNAADGTVTFDRIRYTKTGDYTYKVKELPPEGEAGAEKENGFWFWKSVKYDGEEHTVTVSVTDPNGNGKLVVSASVDGKAPVVSSDVTEGEGQGAVTVNLCKPPVIPFENEYVPKPVSIIIGGNKVLTGRTADPETDKFSFTMKEGDNVVGTSGEISLKADGTGTFEFPMITYTADDMKDPAASTDGKIRYLTSKTIKYVISEDKPAGLQPDADGKYRQNGITYADDKEVTVELSIDENGQMNAKVNGAVLTQTRKNGTVVAYLAPAAASFVNEYAENSVTVSVKKIVDKVATPTGDTFTFNLREGSVDGEILMSRSFVDDGQAHPFIDENAPADKPYTFKYTQAGTYTYYVEEVDESSTHPFYTYSDAAYKIVVTVTPASAGSHELGISKTVDVVDKTTGAAVEEYKGDELEFVNTPVGEGTFNVTGMKIFKIKKSDGTEVEVKPSSTHTIPAYTFELIDKNTGEKVCADVKNDTTTGMFTFATPVKFTQEDLGTHTYILREVLPDGIDRATVGNNKTFELDGTTYDLTEHEVVVTVSIPANNANDRTKLDVKTTVDGQEINEAGYIAKVFGQGDPAAKFNNVYSSAGKIDPPIITKTIVGRELMPGEFSFEVSGSYKLTSGEGVVPKTFGNDDFKIDTMIVKNGIDPLTGKEMKDRPGEIFVDNVDIEYMDLSQSKDGIRYDDYIIMAHEVKPGNAPDEITYSDTKLYLYVHAVDNGKGAIVTSGHGDLQEAGAMPDGTDKRKLAWETEDGKIVTKDDMAAMIENVYLGKTTVKIPGSKVVIGRDLTDKEKNRYSFVLSDFDNDPDKEHAVTINNLSFTQAGVGNFVFDGANGIEMLQYKVGTEVVRDGDGNPVLDKDGKVQIVRDFDDARDHHYRIDEIEYNENNIVTDTRYYIVTVAVEAVEDAANKKVDLVADIKKDANGPMIKRYFADGTEDTTFDPNTGIKFENKYVASTKVSFAGIKKLVDEKDLDKEVKLNKQLAEKFTFELQSFKTEAERSRQGARGQVILSATTPGNGGAYSMGPIEYTQDDLDKNGKAEFFYRIVETPASEGKVNKDGKFESNGIIYDDSQYDIDVILEKIAVGEKDEGKIRTTVKVDGKEVASYVDGAGTVNDLDYSFDFKNPVKVVDIHGKKIWNVKNESDKVPVTINLMANGVKINSTVAQAPDWTYEFKTDSNGNELQASDSRGLAIDYTVDEDVPAGCVKTVEIDKDGNINFINTKGEIVIRKINADTGEALAGAGLQILDGSSVIESWTSEIAPHIVSAKLTPGKTYILHETSAPDGFELAPDVRFVVPSDGKDITVTMSDKPIIGSVRLIKADESTRERLAGAEFALYKENGDRVYATGTTGSYRATTATSNGVFVTDSMGTLTVSDLPYGTYYFIETKAPEGYMLSSERLGFTILRTGELVEVTYLDPKAEGTVRLRKVGSTGTGALSGAVFELYSKTPRTIGQAAASTVFTDAYYRYGTYRTNSAGEIEVTGLPWDDYYFVEVEAPAGYEVMTDVNGDDIVYTFTVSASSADATIDLGGIINNPTTPPPTPTPTPTPGVLGARVKRGGVVNGVLGVRAKPTSGVLGERIGPVTGDASNIILWLLLFTACVATIVATIVTGRKKKTAR